MRRLLNRDGLFPYHSPSPLPLFGRPLTNDSKRRGQMHGLHGKHALYPSLCLSYSFARASQWLLWMYIHCKAEEEEEEEEERTLFWTDRSNGRFIWLDCQASRMYKDRRLPLGGSPSSLTLTVCDIHLFHLYSLENYSKGLFLLPFSSSPLSYICLIPITNTDVTIPHCSSRLERLIGRSLS